MNTIILTSSMDFYYKDEFENIIPHNFGNFNGIFDSLKGSIKKFDNFVFVVSNEIDYETSDYYAKTTFESYNATLPFKNYTVLDGRNLEQAEELIKNADLIHLCGGHVPTQNNFFKKINLRKLLESNQEAVIVGISAGSMNSANMVYCPPELDGEALDPSFNRYFEGLGLTQINVLPHLQDYDGLLLDNLRYIEDIILPDSFNTKILAIPDGSYIFIKDNISTLFGEGYIIENGRITKICDNNNSLILE